MIYGIATVLHGPQDVFEFFLLPTFLAVRFLILSLSLSLSIPLCRLPVLRDAGHGVRSDLRRSDRRFVVRRPRLGGGERPLANGQIGLDRPADQAALQERVAAGGGSILNDVLYFEEVTK